MMGSNMRLKDPAATSKNRKTRRATRLTKWVAGIKRRTAAEAVEIGRASCRGKSVDLGGRRIIKKKNKKT